LLRAEVDVLTASQYKQIIGLLHDSQKATRFWWSHKRKFRAKHTHLIGKGGFGTAYTVRPNDLLSATVVNTPDKVVIKHIVFPKSSSVQEADREREIAIMQRLKGANGIVQLYAAFRYDYEYFLVMNDVGESLFSLLKKGPFPLTNIDSLMQQILQIIRDMHTQSICHRDLNFNNVMVKDGRVSIIDFGLSQVFERGSSLTDICGRTDIMAPEVFRGKYTEKCDLWSAGVLFVEMLTGIIPFYHPNDIDLADKIQDVVCWANCEDRCTCSESVVQRALFKAGKDHRDQTLTKYWTFVEQMLVPESTRKPADEYIQLFKATITPDILVSPHTPQAIIERMRDWVGRRILRASRLGSNTMKRRRSRSSPNTMKRRRSRSGSNTSKAH
jgi:serine/threonine protein kinase